MNNHVKEPTGFEIHGCTNAEEKREKIWMSISEIKYVQRKATIAKYANSRVPGPG